MTSPQLVAAVRMGLDVFEQLQGRRLDGTHANSGSLPHEWSEMAMQKALANIQGECGVTAALWRLANTAMVLVAQPGRERPSKLYLQWHCDVNLHEDRINESHMQLAQRNPAVVDWPLTVCRATQLALSGCFVEAAKMLDAAIDTMSTVEPLEGEAEAMVAEVLGLMHNPPEPTPAAYSSWKHRATELMMDARHALAVADADAHHPLGMIKALLLDVVQLASGDEQALGPVVNALDLDGMWYVAGYAAFINPGAALAELGAALDRSTPSDDTPWFEPVVRTTLNVNHLHDLVQVGRCVHQCVPADATVCERYALGLFAAHVADIGAPTWADVGDAGAYVVQRNQLVESYVSLFAHIPTLWAAAATYLAYSPMADPENMARVLQHAAALPFPGATRVGHFMRQYTDEHSAFQTRLRSATRSRVAMSGTAAAALARVFAHYDTIMDATHAAIAQDAAAKALQVNRPAQALRWLTDAGLFEEAAAIVLARLDGWKSCGAPLDGSLNQIGEAVAAGFINIDAADAPDAAAALHLCAALNAAAPCWTPHSAARCGDGGVAEARDASLAALANATALPEACVYDLATVVLRCAHRVGIALVELLVLHTQLSGVNEPAPALADRRRQVLAEVHAATSRVGSWGLPRPIQV